MQFALVLHRLQVFPQFVLHHFLYRLRACRKFIALVVVPLLFQGFSKEFKVKGFLRDAVELLVIHQSLKEDEHCDLQAELQVEQKASCPLLVLACEVEV